MRTVLTALALVTCAAVPLAACQPKLKTPVADNTCYFIGHVKDNGAKVATPRFNPIGKDVPDMEHCAVLLYNVRMGMLTTNTAGDQTEGEYNGSFLVATNHEVRSSTTYQGPYFPFLVKAPDNRLVQPGSIVVDDETQGDGKQQTVTVPKDLPQKSGNGVVVTQNPGDAPRKAVP